MKKIIVLLFLCSCSYQTNIELGANAGIDASLEYDEAGCPILSSFHTSILEPEGGSYSEAEWQTLHCLKTCYWAPTPSNYQCSTFIGTDAGSNPPCHCK